MILYGIAIFYHKTKTKRCSYNTNRRVKGQINRRISAFINLPFKAASSFYKRCSQIIQLSMRKFLTTFSPSEGYIILTKMILMEKSTQPIGRQMAGMTA